MDLGEAVEQGWVEGLGQSNHGHLNPLKTRQHMDWLLAARLKFPAVANEREEMF